MTKDKQLGKEMLHGRNGQGPFSAWLVRQQPLSCPREGCLLDPQERERGKVDTVSLSLSALHLIHTVSHSLSLSLTTKIKPWNNIPNAEEGSSITLWYSSLPSTCFIHHLSSVLCLAVRCQSHPIRQSLEQHADVFWHLSFDYLKYTSKTRCAESCCVWMSSYFTHKRHMVGFEK